MKKTLVLYRHYADENNWREQTGARIYRARGLQRAKLDNKLFILLMLGFELSTYYKTRLKQENIVELVWLGDARERAAQGDCDWLQTLLPSRFDPKKNLPDRDMGLHGMAQFHSIAVRVRTVANGRIKPRKAWYMFHTKNWMYENTTEVVVPIEWYTSWFQPEA
jgi:hypothetical protein